MILVVDDEARIRELVARALEGREVIVAATEVEAREHLENADLVLLDLRLGESDGMNLLRNFRIEKPDLPIIIMTAFATIESAVEAIKAGAHDYITKPFVSLDDLRYRVDRAVEESRLRRENSELRTLLVDQDRFEEMIGASEPMRRVYQLIDVVARNDATVLITGESGTGKELVARAIHRRGPRARRPFVAINCAAIPETLLESELFGYEKGAFTGAFKTKKGLFESAPGGTIFLDEIGEMPTTLQVKLLRVLEEKSFTRLGGSDATKVEIRLLAATNRDLTGSVRSGEFREDLYFRLAVMHIDIPPLRDRPGDVERLIAALLPDVAISSDAMKHIVEHSWPGNVRELKNFAERVKGMNLNRVEAVDVKNLLSTHSARRAAITGNLPEMVENYEKELISKALKDAAGSRVRASEILGLSRQALQYKLEKYRISW